MATIKKNDNGTYKIVVSLGRNADKKQIRETITFTPTEKAPSKIKKEVERFAMEFEDRCKNGSLITGDKLTLDEFVKEWKENDPTVLGWSAKVRQGNFNIIDKKILPKLGYMKLTKITTRHLQSFITELSQSKVERYDTGSDEDKKLSPGTVKRIFSVVRSVFNYADDMELIGRNPCDKVKLPKSDHAMKDSIHVWTPEQAKRFLQFLDVERVVKYSSHTRTIKDKNISYLVPEYTEIWDTPYQYKVYFNVAIYGGFRRGEMIGLQWKDIDFDNKTISISKSISSTKEGPIVKTPKTKAGKRKVKMPSHVMEILHEWKYQQKELSLALGSLWEGYRGKDFDSNWIFINTHSGMRMDLNTPYHKLKDLIIAYNTTASEEEVLPDIRLHDLRHTYATWLLENNVPASTTAYNLGHADIRTTYDFYVESTSVGEDKALSVLEQIANAM